MTDAIWVSIITAIGTVVGVWLTNRSQQKLMMAELEKKFDLQSQKFTMQIETLTREVSRHNNFADKIPVMEEQINELRRTRPS